MSKRKRTRRGRWKPKISNSFMYCDKWQIYYSNIRGFSCRALSLSSILDSHKVEVCLLSETLLKNNKTIEIPGFSGFCKNRRASFGGGIATMIRNDEVVNTLKMSEGDENNEYIVSSMTNFLLLLI